MSSHLYDRAQARLMEAMSDDFEGSLSGDWQRPVHHNCPMQLVFRGRVGGDDFQLTKEPREDMSKNPYDRRGAGTRENAEQWFGGEVFVPGRATARVVEATPGFGLARLESLMMDEFGRGKFAGRQEADEANVKVVQEAQRTAWDQGRLAGLEEGRQQAVHRFGVEFSEALMVAETGVPKNMPKAGLQRAVDDAHRLLGRIRNAWSEGFIGVVDGEVED